MPSFNRRRLLAGFAGCALEGVMGLPAASASEAAYDLVIVGAGGAGLTAACIALGAGARRVAVLESEPVVGGSSAICGGLWAVSGTELQRKLHIQDSDERFYQDILEIGQHRNSEEQVRAYIDNNRRQFNWVRSTLGIEARTVVPGAGVERAHAMNPRALVAGLYRRARSMGADIFCSMRAGTLDQDRRSGRICGCQAVKGGKIYNFKSRAGVVLATGGFGRNRAMLAAFSPRMRFVSSISAQGSRGDGLRMARSVGAGLSDMQYLRGSYAFTLNPSTVDDMTLISYYGAVIVNSDSHRFVDESLPYQKIADSVLMQTGGRSWLVFDEKIRKEALAHPFDRHLWEPLSRGRVPSYVIRGRTLKEAAGAAGLDPVELQKSIDAYNVSLKGGHPPRGKLSNADPALLPVAEPPFFIMPATVCLLGTYCGVTIDGHARVLDRKGRVIPGLWAAGEVTGGLHGTTFIMGTGFSKAQVFGRIAALDAIAGAKS